jgi:hypothetical protein
MERYQINLNTRPHSKESITINKMYEYEDELRIISDGSSCDAIYVGDEIAFSRTIGGKQPIVLMEYVTVLGVEGNIIRTTKLSRNRYPLLQGFSNLSYIVNDAVKHYIIKCKTKHDIFFQDVFASNGQEIYVKDYQGNLLGTFSDISVPSLYTDRELVVDDFLFLNTKEETCGKNYKYITYYQYDFFNNVADRARLIVRDFDPYIMDKMSYFETKYNPFYYYKIELDDDEKPLYVDDMGRPIKTCTLYGDVIWDMLSERQVTETKSVIVNGSRYRNTILKDSGYWNFRIGLSEDVDVSTLGSDERFNESYVNEIKESLTPEVIDMERVKYIPMVHNSGENTYLVHVWENIDTQEKAYSTIWVDDTTPYGTEIILYDSNKEPHTCEWKNGYAEDEEKIFVKTNEVLRNDLDIATELELYFHFRKRVKTGIGKENTNSTMTKDNIYADGWYIDTETEAEQWWNGMNYNGPNFNKEQFNRFINENAEKSDLIGYLNFTDNDIFYRKQKVSKSFVRLSFYTSDDPLEQKLLYYSTIFLDGGLLYGDFLKQKDFLKKNGELKDIENNTCGIVMYDSGTSRIDTKITVTNEYDRTRSAEGFNLYLFASDKNIKVDEKGERTIYMKVEFNHAGNGKTIPMIVWPKFYWDDEKKEYVETNTYQPLTIDNFVKALYIPVKISYFNGRFVYYIKDAYRNENGKISLVLFEPKIETLEEDANG